MERAKELFLKYNGSHFHMDREGDGNEYGAYHISRETEKSWAEEYILLFLEMKLRGKDAKCSYSAVTDLLNYIEHNDVWKRCLYYPFTSEHLDDVTVLYMLPDSFRMAEKAVKKVGLSKEDMAAYIQNLDAYIDRIKERIECGTLSREPDYVFQEFSDPVYVTEYLAGLRKKWNDLSIQTKDADFLKE